MNTAPKNLPQTPGVYLFLGTRKNVLYVGKATNLRDRVRSYFEKDLAATRGPALVAMVECARTVEYKPTDSVLEALILEADLIKKLKPKYNTLAKDDKSFNHVVITKEPWPRVLTMRRKELLQQKNRRVLYRAEYGPFPHGGMLKEALRLIREIFPYYDTKRSVEELHRKQDKRVRFNESIGIYPLQGTTREDYAQTIRHIRLLFEGKKKQLLQLLEKEMHAAAKAQQFERAALSKKQLFALQHINDVSLLKREHKRAATIPAKRIEAYDIAHLGGEHMVGVLTVIENGEPQKSEYRKFKIRTVSGSNDTAALREVLTRRFSHSEWRLPGIIVVDGSTAQKNTAHRVLKEFGYEIPVVAVTKDARHRPVKIQGTKAVKDGYAADILLANSESHRFAIGYHKQRRSGTFRP